MNKLKLLMNKSLRLKSIGLLLLLLATTTVCFGQTVKLKGVVLSNEKEPLIGVTISNENKTIGTMTDADGQFEIESAKGTKLIVSYVGFIPQTVIVGDKTQLSITLIEDFHMMEEVVVIGYGTTKKKDLTGAVSGIREDVLQQSKASSFLNSMQGRVAGVQITTGSGEPGSGSKVLIRGANTLAGSSDPLYVIDGIQVNESDASIASS